MYDLSAAHHHDLARVVRDNKKKRMAFWEMVPQDASYMFCT